MPDFLKQFILVRGPQLLARFVATCFVFAAGKAQVQISPEEAAQAADPVSLLLIGGLLYAIDLVIHWMRPAKAADAPPKALLALPLLLCLPGCFGKSTQADATVKAMEASAISYTKNVSRLVEAFISDYRAQAQGKADQLANDALKAEVGPDGKANAKNLQLILEKKAEHYAGIERNVVSMRGKLIEANKDIDHLLEYSAALKKYFADANQSANLLNTSSEQLIGMLDSFVKGKKSTSAP